jgi:hypothetical protein
MKHKLTLVGIVVVGILLFPVWIVVSIVIGGDALELLERRQK